MDLHGGIKLVGLSPDWLRVDARSALPNAIALNSAMFNAARLIGPAIGGILISNWGEAICFFIDGCSFVAALIALSLLNTPTINSTGSR